MLRRLKGRFVNIYKKHSGFSIGRSVDQEQEEEMFLITLIGSIFLHKEMLPVILFGTLIWSNFYFVLSFIS